MLDQGYNQRAEQADSLGMAKGLGWVFNLNALRQKCVAAY